MQIADVMHLLYRRGLVQVRGGNASIYDPENSLVYISPTGIPRHRISPEDVAVISLKDRIKVVKGAPSSEWRMHIEVYRRVRNARAIVHAHSPYTIALSLLGVKPDPSITTEAADRVKCVNFVGRLRPGTEELATNVGKALEAGCPAAILEGHGVVAYSELGIYHALEIVEALEDLSMIQLYTHIAAGRTLGLREP